MKLFALLILTLASILIEADPGDPHILSEILKEKARLDELETSFINKSIQFSFDEQLLKAYDEKIESSSFSFEKQLIRAKAALMEVNEKIADINRHIFMKFRNEGTLMERVFDNESMKNLVRHIWGTNANTKSELESLQDIKSRLHDLTIAMDVVKNQTLNCENSFLHLTCNDFQKLKTKSSAILLHTPINEKYLGGTTHVFVKSIFIPAEKFPNSNDARTTSLLNCIWKHYELYKQFRDSQTSKIQNLIMMLELLHPQHYN
ncbi:uncharacterized protein LOC116343267 [Contarinia nasturtii]|uniref:uncharacterized protein LOC116343267 n=1 Tax=Contarinia nasturtii TaxID=265458 RepID=UPI0012D47EAA|nr:uncharacterized protein LOC116343267 [Contarinia nasturtii]XP_031627110.1 uncharacterized protein LOC116343267 [Contarinia nasturtii]